MPNFNNNPIETNPYQNFIYLSRYSRWTPEESRRENWEETVDRYFNFFYTRVPDNFGDKFEEAVDAIERAEVMPSMRCLWSCGPALERENIAGYNCSYIVLDRVKAFAEMIYILMNGTGVGFSCERQYINKLPIIPPVLQDMNNIDETNAVVVVEDSKEGWAEAYQNLLEHMYCGVIPQIDYSQVRPKGAILKTFGGRASGPEPLKQLMEFTINVFKNAKDRKLNSLECHDLACYIANCVVSGGVRRSACISLSNPSDYRMAHAKDGEFWNNHPHRALANNSAVYTEKPNAANFLETWTDLIRSGSGERGIFNREAAQTFTKRNGRRDYEGQDFGTNPCGEILLRPNQFCNLSEVVIKPTDDKESLLRKVEHAVILGILQSTLTKFNFIDNTWTSNTKEERLLGVSLTGLCDHPILKETCDAAKILLGFMRDKAITTAEIWANALGIPVPKAITCVKPSGTVSQLVNCASGLHARFAKYYIRRVRCSITDPLAKFMIEQGYPWHPEVGQNADTCNTVVFEFPIKSPEDARIRGEYSAIEELEYWKMLKEFWCEHNPSCTIYVKESEWIEVGAWVYRNWDIAGGLSFLPYSGGVYQLAPYEEINEATFQKLCSELPEVDFSLLQQYEQGDTTKGGQEYACTGDNCEI